MTDKIINVNDSDFEENVLKASGLVLVQYWAEWNGTCKMIWGLIDELAEHYSGKLTVGRIDIDCNQSAIAEYNVHSIPTVILFKNGKEVDRKLGPFGRGEIRNFIDTNL